MINNAPGFFKEMTADPQNQERLSVLEDEPAKDEIVPEKETPDVEAPPAEIPPKDPAETPPVENKDLNTAPPADPNTPPVDPAVVVPPAPAKKTVTFNGKEYDAEEFEAIQSAVNKGVSTEPVKQEPKDAEIIEKLQNTPLITIENLPRAENFNITDKDGNKTFDMDGYANEFAKVIAMQVQRAIIGGPLGTVHSGLTAKQMFRHMETNRLASETDKKVEEISNKLVEKFPILNKDVKIGLRVERALAGEAARRKNAAVAAGKAEVPMTYEEIEKIVYEEISLSPATPDNSDAPIETKKGSPPMKNGTPAKPAVGVDKDIEDMEKMSKSGRMFTSM